MNVAIFMIISKNFYALAGILMLTNGKCATIYRLCSRLHIIYMAPANIILITKFPTRTVYVALVKSPVNSTKSFVNLLFSNIFGA